MAPTRRAPQLPAQPRHRAVHSPAQLPQQRRQPRRGGGALLGRRQVAAQR
jgi:hypothetical protein